MAKIICTKKDTGKRLLVDTILEPNYKYLYNDESGVEFCIECQSKAKEVKAPKIEPVKAKKSKSSKKNK